MRSSSINETVLRNVESLPSSMKAFFLGFSSKNSSSSFKDDDKIDLSSPVSSDDDALSDVEILKQPKA